MPGGGSGSSSPSFLLLKPSPSSLHISSISSPHFPMHSAWKNRSFFLPSSHLSLYWFPGAAVTNPNELGGLKQHRFILLTRVLRPEVQDQFCWPKVKVWTEAGPLEAPGKSPFSCFSKASGGCQWSLVRHHSNLCFCSYMVVESPFAFLL